MNAHSHDAEDDSHSQNRAQRGKAALADGRSQTGAWERVGVIREIYGLMTVHFVVCKAMFDAACMANVSPRRISFTSTWKILRVRLPKVPRSCRDIKRWHHDLITEVGEDVLPPRRNRINPRAIKKTQSKWPRARSKHRKLPS